MTNGYITNVIQEFKSIGQPIEASVDEELTNANRTNTEAKLEECEARAAEAEVKEKELNNKDLEQTIKFRETLTNKLQNFIMGWMIFIALTIIAFGYNYGVTLAKTGVWFYIPEKIMIALICTTTANIIGLFAIVTNYFFPNKGKSNSK